MNTQRTVSHLVGVTLLLLWGGVLLYFYTSGRLAHYLPGDGIFQPMVLVAAIIMLVLGVFNLATMGAEVAGCDDHACGHDHHDHSACGHDHSHDHAQHAHAGCCGHDHSHSHEHAPAKGHDHAHGVLDESGPIGRTFAILILSVPLLLAATMTPDRFSALAIENKGVQTMDYNNVVNVPTRVGSNAAKPQTSIAVAPDAKVEQAPALTPSVTALPPATVATTPPAPTASEAGAGRVPGSSAPATASVATTNMTTPPPAKETKSYGTFTLADLKAQVPMSKEGNFILEVPELYYTAGDKEVQGVLAGQPVETTAQVLPEKVGNADGKRLRIFRLLVQCCAADARPFSVPAEFAEKAPTFKDTAWVKVVGTMAYKQEGGQTVPVVMVKTMTETTAPDNAMLY